MATRTNPDRLTNRIVSKKRSQSTSALLIAAVLIILSAGLCILIPFENRDVELDGNGATIGRREPDHRVVWTLVLNAELPGIDYNVDFEVPVFRT